MRTSLILLCLTALVGCGSPQKPYSFNVPGGRADVIDTAVRTLAAEGHQVDSIDEVAGVIHTKWQDTGRPSFSVDGSDASLVRRIAVIVQPVGDRQTLTLRADVKTCALGGFEVDDVIVSGRCQHMNKIPAATQQEVDRLGQQIQAALSTDATVTTPATESL